MKYIKFTKEEGKDFFEKLGDVISIVRDDDCLTVLYSPSEENYMLCQIYKEDLIALRGEWEEIPEEWTLIPLSKKEMDSICSEYINKETKN